MECDDDENRSCYVREFLAMLSKGLFVFVYIPATDGLVTRDVSSNNCDVKKHFCLRVFSYEQDDECLLISALNSEPKDNDHVFPLDSIFSLEKSGTQGIRFLSESKCTLTEIVLSDSDDCETLLQGLKICLPRIDLQEVINMDSEKELSMSVGDLSGSSDSLVSFVGLQTIPPSELESVGRMHTSTTLETDEVS